MELNKIHQGNTLDLLKQLEDNSIDCIITSPPYWQLRDYGVEGQLGLEKDFNEYIDKLIQIFNEAKRVLKSTGTLWVNLGDTYNGNKRGKTDNKVSKYLKENSVGLIKKTQYNIRQKSLCMIPERFAIKMIDNGWILRNKIIWHKPNAMPSSVKDRFTVDWEYVFFFVKNKKYYFKQIIEPNHDTYNGKRGKDIYRHKLQSAMQSQGHFDYYGRGRNKRSVWSINTQSFKGAHFAVFPEKLVEPMIEAGCPENGIVLDPFCGSGTTCMVAKKLGKKFLGFEINNEYIKIAEKRINSVIEPIF